MRYHPGETNLRRAHVIVVNKVDTARKEDVKAVLDVVKKVNPEAVVIKAKSPIFVPEGKSIKGKTVLVIEDGPTLTHGEMRYGAGIVAAKKYGARRIVDPRPYAVGTIKKTFQKYGHLDKVLPAMGYGDVQVAELAKTIDRVPCDIVVSATPIDLGRVLKTKKRLLRVRYELAESGPTTLKTVLQKVL
jgi:predicted GTPase